MTDPRLDVARHLHDPPPGKRLWYGGASPLGTLRGVTAKQAAWRPAPERHSIWELTLHIAYWKYAVRRLLEGSPKGSFRRKPASWPAVPEKPTEDAWKKDRALLRSEHGLLADAMESFDPARLDSLAPDSDKWSFADLLFGVITHDIYHVGQIQMLKRLIASQKSASRKRS